MRVDPVVNERQAFNNMQLIDRPTPLTNFTKLRKKEKVAVHNHIKQDLNVTFHTMCFVTNSQFEIL